MSLLDSPRALKIALAASVALNLFAIAGGATLWVTKTKAEDKIEALTNGLPKEYVQKLDYKEDMREIKDLLCQIFDKLDGKADKAA